MLEGEREILSCGRGERRLKAQHTYAKHRLRMARVYEGVHSGTPLILKRERGSRFASKQSV